MDFKIARIKWNREGFRQLRQEPRIRDIAIGKANEIAQEAASIGSGGVPVYKYGSGGTSGYMVTDLVLEHPRGAVSVMATGKALHHDRKYSALLRAASRVAKQ